jgi:hypothetical protein
MKASLLFAGMMLAGMTFAVHAAKPELTGKEKKEMAAKVAANVKKAPPLPKTVEQASAVKLRSSATGAEGLRVPTDLWNTLSVQADANGTMRIVESDGDGSETPKTVEGAPNE